MTTSLLVIGYGNALRGDDGAGPRAATLLGERAGSLRALAAHQLLPEHADEIAHAARVVFIDAYPANGADHEAAPLRIETVEARAGAGTPAAHASSPTALLALCRRLYARTPQAWLVGIPAYELAPGADISPRTLQRIDDAVDFCLAQGER